MFNDDVEFYIDLQLIFFQQSDHKLFAYTSQLLILLRLWKYYFHMLIILNILCFFNIISISILSKSESLKLFWWIKLCKPIVANITLLFMVISYLRNLLRTLHFFFQIPNVCSITERSDAWHLLYISLLVLGDILFSLQILFDMELNIRAY